MTQARSTSTRMPRLALLIVGVGLAVGVVTQLGQAIVPDPWTQVANAIAPWLLVAFLVGSRMPSLPWAAVGGIGTLLFALVGYYGMLQIQLGYGGSSSSYLFWGLGALTGGPIFGVGGFVWVHGVRWQRAAALGLLAAAAIAEGIYNALFVAHPVAGAAFIVVGLLLPLILGRSREDRIGAYVATVPALGLGALGYVAFTWLYDLIAGV